MIDAPPTVAEAALITVNMCSRAGIAVILIKESVSSYDCRTEYKLESCFRYRFFYIIGFGRFLYLSRLKKQFQCLSV